MATFSIICLLSTTHAFSDAHFQTTPPHASVHSPTGPHISSCRYNALYLDLVDGHFCTNQRIFYHLAMCTLHFHVLILHSTILHIFSHSYQWRCKNHQFYYFEKNLRKHLHLSSTSHFRFFYCLKISLRIDFHLDKRLLPFHWANYFSIDLHTCIH